MEMLYRPMFSGIQNLNFKLINQYDIQNNIKSVHALQVIRQKRRWSKIPTIY